MKTLKIVSSVVLAVITLAFAYDFGYNRGVKSGEHNAKYFPIDTIDYQKPILDSVRKTRDSIIFKINYIDSITYEKIKETNSLVDSDAVNLFIELVSE